MQEAEHFADGGFQDILYAVILEPSKLERCKVLAARLKHFHVLIDSLGESILMKQQVCFCNNNVCDENCCSKHEMQVG